MHGAGSCQGFSGGRSRGGAAGCERTHECVARQGGSRGPAPAGLQTPPSWAQGEATLSCLPLGTSQATLTSPSEAASSPLGPGDGCCPRSVTSLSLSVLQRFPTCAFGSAQGLLEPPLQPRPLPVPWGLSRSPRPQEVEMEFISAGSCPPKWGRTPRHASSVSHRPLGPRAVCSTAYSSFPHRSHPSTQDSAPSRLLITMVAKKSPPFIACFFHSAISGY